MTTEAISRCCQRPHCRGSIYQDEDQIARCRLCARPAIEEGARTAEALPRAVRSGTQKRNAEPPLRTQAKIRLCSGELAPAKRLTHLERLAATAWSN